MQTSASLPEQHKNKTSHLPAFSIYIAFLLLLIDGGTTPYTLLSSTGILLLAFLIRWPHRIPVTAAGTCMAGFMALAFITSVPAPDPLLYPAGSTSAEHHRIANQALSESFSSGLISNEKEWYQISRNRAGTLRAILLLSMAWLAASLARQIQPASKKKILICLSAAACIIAIAGIIAVYIHPQEKTFWWILPVLHGRPVACFINENHFGSFMALAAVIVPGLLCRSEKKRSLPINILLITVLMLLSAAVIASRSKGALLAFAAGMTIASAINFRKRPLFIASLIIILITGMSASVFLLGDNSARGPGIRKSFSASGIRQSIRLRADTWKDVLPVIRSHPLLGTGLNAFRSVFPQHRTSATRKEHNNVENEYIQIPAETGIIGTSILITALTMLVINLRRNNTLIPALFPVILPAITVIAAHSFVDFPARIPIYMLTFAVLLSFCIPANPSPDRRKLKNIPEFAVCGITAFTLLLSIIAPYKTFSLDSPDYLNHAEPNRIAEAISSSPSYWHAYYNLGRHAARNPDLRDLAEAHLTTASQLNPLNYKLLTELALLRLDMGKLKEAREAYLQAKVLRNWLNISTLEPLLKHD